MKTYPITVIVDLNVKIANKETVNYTKLANDVKSLIMNDLQIEAETDEYSTARNAHNVQISFSL